MEQVQQKGLENGVLSFALSGDIDSSSADAFYGVVATAYDAQKTDVVFDCERLAFIDSTTLGTFVKIMKKVKADGHNVKLVGLQPNVKKLFLICSLDKVMEIA